MQNAIYMHVHVHVADQLTTRWGQLRMSESEKTTHVLEGEKWQTTSD